MRIKVYVGPLRTRWAMGAGIKYQANGDMKTVFFVYVCYFLLVLINNARQAIKRKTHMRHGKARQDREKSKKRVSAMLASRRMCVWELCVRI